MSQEVNFIDRNDNLLASKVLIMESVELKVGKYIEIDKKLYQVIERDFRHKYVRVRRIRPTCYINTREGSVRIDARSENRV